MNKEEQFLKVEIKLAERVLCQFKEEACIIIQLDKEYLDRMKHLLKFNFIEESCTRKYVLIPGEGIWPYEGSLAPSFFACSQFDPIPLIIGLEKVRQFLEDWDSEE